MVDINIFIMHYVLTTDLDILVFIEIFFFGCYIYPNRTYLLMHIKF